MSQRPCGQAGEYQKREYLCKYLRRCAPEAQSLHRIGQRHHKRYQDSNQQIDKNGVCHFEFSIKERGQYKIDFYNTATGEIIRNDAFHYIQASGKDIKHVEKKGTNWKVDSAEGLRLRNSPWGEKVGLLENETLLVQTEETLYPFYDFIDGQYGFWIPVKIVNKPEDYNSDYKEKLICDYPDETDGWVFSGFLKKMD